MNFQQSQFASTAARSPMAGAAVQTYIIKGVVALSAVIMGVMALILLTGFFGGLEDAIRTFGKYSGAMSVVGTTCFILIGLLGFGLSGAFVVPLGSRPDG